MSVPFGSEVTAASVKALEWYQGRDVKQEDLAREAMRLIQGSGRNMAALQNVVDLKARYGTGCSTLFMVYNATGTTLQLIHSHSWSGRIYQQEPPREFRNGQWISFLHVRVNNRPRTDSCGCLVFRGTKEDNSFMGDREFLVAWKTPWDGGNKVLTEIRGRGHFGYWNYLYELLGKQRKTCEDTTDQNFRSSISIGGVTSPECIAILQHKFEPLPDEY